jgi:osmotically-inducible protein OsmY
MKALFLLITTLSLTGCIAAAVGAGALATSAAVQDGGVGGAATDTRIQTALNDLWLRHDVRLFEALTSKVYNRRVLVMGMLPNEAERQTAITLAQRPAGVREVLDATTIGARPGWRQAAVDKRIETVLDARLPFADGIKNLNYQTNVFNGVVYILGTAQTALEKRRLLNLASTIEGVREVKDYIEVR